MSKKLTFVFTILMAILICGFLVVKSYQHPKTQTSHKINQPSKSNNELSSDQILDKGAHYPNLPHELDFSGIGQHIVVLNEAKNRHEIVKWADDNHLLRVQNVGYSFFVAMSDYLSGDELWAVYLYGYHPLKSGDPNPWKLLYVGSEGLKPIKSSEDIQCVYIDGKTRSLVFANSRTGKITKSIRIDKELKLMKM